MVTFDFVSSLRIVADDLFSTLPNPTCALVTECGLFVFDICALSTVAVVSIVALSSFDIYPSIVVVASLVDITSLKDTTFGVLVGIVSTGVFGSVVFSFIFCIPSNIVSLEYTHCSIVTLIELYADAFLYQK